MVPLLTNKSDLSQFDISAGFVVLINKEQDWTSFDVVKKLRNFLHVKKIGHGGTLDPFATGLMLIGVGKGTKALHELSAMNKSYRAVIHLGRVTDTYDRTGTEVAKIDTSSLQFGDIEKEVKNLTGKIEQVPPMYSAKRVNGVRLYKLARKNIEVERKPQQIEILNAEIIKWHNPFLTIELDVTKGTYIRSYAYDLGANLKVGGSLEELERTAVDTHKLEDSFSISEFMTAYREINANN